MKLLPQFPAQIWFSYLTFFFNLHFFIQFSSILYIHTFSVQIYVNKMYFLFWFWIRLNFTRQCFTKRKKKKNFTQHRREKKPQIGKRNRGKEMRQRMQNKTEVCSTISSPLRDFRACYVMLLPLLDATIHQPDLNKLVSLSCAYATFNFFLSCLFLSLIQFLSHSFTRSRLSH